MIDECNKNCSTCLLINTCTSEKTFYSEYKGRYIRIDLKVKSCSDCGEPLIDDDLKNQYNIQLINGKNKIDVL